MAKKEISAIPLSTGRIRAFLDYLRKKGRSEATLSKYAASLQSFYDFLPKEKLLMADSLKNWRDALIDAGFATRTVNTRIAACNSLLSYLNRKGWQVSPFAIEAAEITTEVTREDYYELLKAAHHSNNEWLYCLIKSFCCLGVAVSELPCLTVGAIVEGKALLTVKKQARIIRIPEVLQVELLSFAKRANINSGSLFKSQDGKPLTKAYILKELQALCIQAGIPVEKGTPRSLQALYFKTYSKIRSRASALVEEAYCKILEEEDKIIGWKSIEI